MSNLPTITQADVKRSISTALCSLYGDDGDLLSVDASERSITHKLAEHLQNEFPDFHVDCEYNRWGTDTKRLSFSLGSTRPDSIEARTVFPDIIVHRRRTNDNLLVIEVKKATSHEDTKDDKKLRAFTGNIAHRYRFGLFLKLGERGCVEALLYQNGSQSGDWTSDIERVLKQSGCRG